MAMTKLEKAAFAQLQERLALSEAFRLTAKVLPDVMPPANGGLSVGYLPSGDFEYPRAEDACSSSVSHSNGSRERTRAQGARRLYSTKALAMKSYRNEFERYAQSLLANFDRLIEKYESEEDAKP